LSQSAIDRWTRRRKQNHEWEHSLHRYVTIGRHADRLRAVWDAARGQRVSRWLTPENAERVRADCEQGWRMGQVTGWVIKIGREETS
jgi:hypothetical protein